MSISKEEFEKLVLEIADSVTMLDANWKVIEFAHALIKAVQEKSEVVGEMHKAHCRDVSGEDHWCKEILLYSPNNPGDIPEYRNKVVALPLVEGD